MDLPHPDPHGDHDELEHLAGLFTEAVRRGESPSIEEFAGQHPEHAEALREILPAIDTLEAAARTVAPAAAALPFDRVGEYVLQREAGRGGMAVVYEARHESLGRRVALKLLPQAGSLTHGFRERFEREAQAAARLEHPNIVPVHGAGEHEGLPYFVMQFVDGRGLDRVLDELRGAPLALADDSGLAARLRSKALPEEGSVDDAVPPVETAGSVYFQNVARIGLQVAQALDHAHAHGILHRDVKPANLLLDARGKVWVSDFGLCKDEGSSTLTAAGDFVGTLRYMAPEQFEGHADVRSDVYGLGLTLYELATQRPAFDAPGRAQLVHQILGAAPARPRRIDAAIPADLERIVQKAMARLPEERYGTAGALAQDLRAFLEGRPIAARPPSALYLARLVVRRNKVFAATVAAALAIVAIATAWYVMDLKKLEASRTRQVYAANIGAAESSLRLLDGRTAARWLDSAPEGLRGWEWHNLRRRLDQPHRQFETPVSHRTRDTQWSMQGDLAYVEGGRFVAALVGQGVSIFDTDTGEFVSTLTTAAETICLAPAGREDRIVTGHADGSVNVWEVPHERPLHTTTLGQTVQGVAAAEGGERVAVGFVEGGVALLDGSLRPIATVPSDGRDARILRVEGDVVWFVRHAMGRVDAWRWNAPGEPELLRSCHHTELVAGVDLSPDRELLATGARDHLVRLWPLRRDAPPRVLRGHGGRVGDVDFAPDGRSLTSVSDDLTLRRWDVESGATLNTMYCNADELPPSFMGLGTLESVVVSADGSRLLTTTAIGALEWEMGRRDGRRALLGNLVEVLSVDFGADGQLAAGGGDTIVRIWDRHSNRPRRVFLGHDAAVGGLDFHPEGHMLASLDNLGGLIVWDVNTSNELARVATQTIPRADPVFVAGGSRIVAPKDGGVGEWSVEGVLEASYELAGPCSALAASPSGDVVAVADRNGGLAILESPGLSPSASPAPLESGYVASIAFARNGETIATVDTTDVLQRHDARTGIALGWPGAPEGRRLNESVRAIAYSRDGSRLLAATATGSLLLLHPATGQELATLAAHGRRTSDLAVDPGSGRVATCGSDSFLWVWEGDPVDAAAAPPVGRDELAAEARSWVAEAYRTDRPRAVIESLHRDAGLPVDVREARLAAAHDERGGARALEQHALHLLTDPSGRPPFALVLAIQAADTADPGYCALVAVYHLRTGNLVVSRRFFDQAGKLGEARGEGLDAIYLAYDALHLARDGRLEAAAERLDEATESGGDDPLVATVVEEAAALLLGTGDE